MQGDKLKIKGMHCDGCAKTIEALLAAEPGVTAASANHSGGSARVLYDPTVIDPPQLVAAIERAGYRVVERRHGCGHG